jgi:hypothetical protein
MPHEEVQLVVVSAIATPATVGFYARVPQPICQDALRERMVWIRINRLTRHLNFHAQSCSVPILLRNLVGNVDLNGLPPFSAYK